MKPFDIELAKQGRPVCTRDGRPVRIVCFDKKGEKDEESILALVEEQGKEKIRLYKEDGCYYHISKESELDLVMAGEKKVGWANVFVDGSGHYNLGNVFDTEEDARNAEYLGERVDTIKIEFEA